MASQLLEPSIEPSRTRQSRFESHELHTTSANIASRLTASIESRSELTALEFFAQELVTSGLPGPAVVVGEKVFQGQGAQFMVYRQQWMMKHDEDYSLCYDVAVKQPKFQLDPNVRLNLADRHTRHHVHSIHLEILALTHPVLRRHRNIARLLAWSYDLYSYHLPFTLIMELAHSNLANFLQEDHFEKSQALRFSLCQDIADALDTIHSCGLVHGDLKAANVLIFLHRNRVIAKLADFGICIDQSISVDGGHYLQGTRGWQAPEVEYGNSQNASYLVKADNYSFGLIVWTIFLHDGNAPHSSLSITRQTVAITEIETCEELFRTPIRLVILRAVGTLLEPNPADRPESVAILFQRKDADMLRIHSDAVHTPRSRDKDGETSRLNQATSFEPYLPFPGFGSPAYPWELPYLDEWLLHSLYSLFVKGGNLPKITLFTMFLAFTYIPPKYSESATPAVDVLCAAAEQDYEPAFAVVTSAFRYYGISLYSSIRPKVTSWLSRAVSSGCIYARIELEKLDRTSLVKSIQSFESGGGYNRFYFPHVDIIRSRDSSATGNRQSQLCSLVKFGSVDELRAFFEVHGTFEVNKKTQGDETPVYLACVRGSLVVTNELLRRGADPTIPCTDSRITCLHWTFTFKSSDQREAVASLLKHGACIEACSERELQFPHYPFVLPKGAPLHWATVMGSHSAQQALIESGANVLARDKSDPYKYDERIRILNRFGEVGHRPYSTTEGGTMGLSSLDISAMQHDPFIFELLQSRGQSLNINDVDEEGFSVLHRLSTNYTRYTGNSNPYSDVVYHGSLEEMRDNLKRTMTAIRSLGGDLELLTTPRGNNPQRQTWSIQEGSRTPLMLAVLACNVDVARALLEAGASVHTENEWGVTALFLAPTMEPLEHKRLACAALLFEYGASATHLDKTGQSAIMCAAAAGDAHIVDLFLSKGANIDERVMDITSLRENCTVFQQLCEEDKPFNNDIDSALANLLETYVFQAKQGPDKIRSVVEQGDAEDRTLLHYVARYSMVNSARVLLRHGANSNPLAKRYTMRSIDGKRFKIFWIETPLNEALNAYEARKKRMIEDRNLARKAYDDLCSRNMAMVMLLKDYGGVEASAEKHRKPVPSGMTSLRELRDL